MQHEGSTPCVRISKVFNFIYLFRSKDDGVLQIEVFIPSDVDTIGAIPMNKNSVFFVSNFHSRTIQTARVPIRGGFIVPGEYCWFPFNFVKCCHEFSDCCIVEICTEELEVEEELYNSITVGFLYESNRSVKNDSIEIMRI